ncbi:hypothetical protein M427DRAFT_59020 [Gonapodya prolifera JEL478]|uniref:Uncharacterized protein n=1 Tax=Gonapodya prolifera (strain JEL478) TaxID=1344416 RepID=A0A139A8K3_GONPJ|nr:hypothetical protein M427DRAFT_59020 [Gonapodya prolifera JEL478]|eukprot:KXS13122.1 hypothetical protein M427DRAFT_59020 [Gonapodya prolifera JEL478]
MAFLFRRTTQSNENPFLDAAAAAQTQSLNGTTNSQKQKIHAAPSDSLSALTLSESDGSDTTTNDTFSLHSNSAATMSAQKEEEIIEENILLRQQLVRLADQVSADEERKEFEFTRRLKELELQHQCDLDDLNEAHERDADEWRQEISSLRAQLATSQTEVHRLSARAAQLADDLDQARERCSVLQGQIDGVREDRDGKIQRLEAEAEDLHAKLADAHRARVQAQVGQRQQEELVDSLKNKYAAVSSHLIELREDHNRLLRILESVRGPTLRVTDHTSNSNRPGSPTTSTRAPSPSEPPFSPVSTTSSSTETSQWSHAHSAGTAPALHSSSTSASTPASPIRRAYTLRVATSRMQDPSLAEHGGAAAAGTLHLGGARLVRKPSASIPRRRNSPMMAAAEAVSLGAVSPGAGSGAPAPVGAAGDKPAVLDVVPL